MSNLIRITIFDRENQKIEIEAPTDMNLSLMEICKANDLPVEGTCGGMALCASCHCYIESEHQLPEPKDNEIEMLEQAFFTDDEKSRLACQIKLTNNLDGLTIKLAPVAI